MKLYRVLVEIKYLAPLYLDSKGRIIKEYEERYPELTLGFHVDPLQGAIRMENPQRGVKVFISGRRCGIEMEFEPLSLDAFSGEAGRFCRTISRDILKVESVNRIGMRYFYRWPVPRQDVVAFTLKEMLCAADDVSDAPITRVNWSLRLESADDDYKYTFQFYPELVKEDDEEKLSGSLVMDIDAYQNARPVSALTSLQGMIQEAQHKSMPIGTRLLERVVWHGQITD